MSIPESEIEKVVLMTAADLLPAVASVSAPLASPEMIVGQAIAIAREMDSRMRAAGIERTTQPQMPQGLIGALPPGFDPFRR